MFAPPLAIVLFAAFASAARFDVYSAKQYLQYADYDPKYEDRKVDLPAVKPNGWGYSSFDIAGKGSFVAQAGANGQRAICKSFHAGASADPHEAAFTFDVVDRKLVLRQCGCHDKWRLTCHIAGGAETDGVVCDPAGVKSDDC